MSDAGGDADYDEYEDDSSDDDEILVPTIPASTTSQGYHSAHSVHIRHDVPTPHMKAVASVLQLSPQIALIATHPDSSNGFTHRI